MDLLFFGLFLGSFLQVRTQFNTDGFIVHPRRDCPGNDFMGGHVVSSFEECRQLCEVHSQCVGMVFRPYYTSGVNCWPKSVCERLNYLGGAWATYKRIPDQGGCTFDKSEGFALYGHNDVSIESINVLACKKQCLWDKNCKSFDHFGEKNLCLLSYESRETVPSFFKQHKAMTYYHKRCGTDVEPVAAEVLSASGATYWMKDGNCIKSIGPFGSRNGRDFTDETFLYRNITEVIVGYGTYIYSVTVKYGSTVRFHGGSGGTTVSTVLNPGEFITRVEGKVGSLIDKLLFTTNQRTVGPFGSDGGVEFSAESDGKPLLYLSGFTHGRYVNNLSFNFAC